jgi:ribokinase
MSHGAKTHKATSVGELMMEVICRTRVLPAPNSTTLIETVSPPLGGAALNVCWYLAQLGIATHLVAPVGRSERRSLQSMLKGLRVDMSRILTIQGHSDQLITTLTKTEHRSVYLLAELPLNSAHKIAELCPWAPLAVLNGGRHRAIREFYVRSAPRDLGELVAFNPSYAIYEYSTEELDCILAKVDVVFINDEEYHFLRKRLPRKRIDKCLLDRGAPLIVTRGSKGIEVVHKTGTWRAPSKIKRKGVFLGAGDAFTAGFLSEYLNGKGLHAAAQAGLILAALVVRTGKIRATPRDNPSTHRR